MKILATSTLALALTTFSFAAPSMASTRFSCPSEEQFLGLWNDTVTHAKPITLADAVTKAQAEAYQKIWTKGIPNHDLLTNQFTFEGKTYDLVVVAGSFIFNPDYLDSYGVIFEKGQSEAIAVIKTDTDRSDYVCTATVFPDRIVIPSDEFEMISIDSPQDVPVEINGVRYEHFYVISHNLAIAQNSHGETITIVRGK